MQDACVVVVSTEDFGRCSEGVIAFEASPFPSTSAEFLDKSFTMSASKAGRAITDMKARRLSAPARSKAVKRPEDIVRDVRGLKLRQRVSLVLNDKVLREELEDIVENFVHNGPKHGENIRAYQDFLVPNYGGTAGGSVVTPIADIRGSDTLNYSKQERLLRCKVASVYRLVDVFGWSSGIYGHITVSRYVFSGLYTASFSVILALCGRNPPRHSNGFNENKKKNDLRVMTVKKRAGVCAQKPYSSKESLCFSAWLGAYCTY